jgi:hypothetical protein
VQQFNQALPPEKIAPAVVVQERERTGLSPWAILGIVVAVILVGFVGYEWWAYSQSGSGGGQVAAVPTPTPAPSPAAGTSAGPVPDASPSASRSPIPAALKHSLAVRLTQRSWLRVTVDGKTEIEGILPAGTQRTFAGSVADLRVGNAGGVEVSVDGAPPAALGNPGDVVEAHYKL